MDKGIKAVFYDSATNSFVKLFPDEITEVNPNYTPIGVEVVPAEHNVYGTGQAGIMSLAEMNYNTPDTGTNTHNDYMCWGGYETDTSLPNYDVVNYIGSNGSLNNGVVQGTTPRAFLPSDQFIGSNGVVQGTTPYAFLPSDKTTKATGLDGHSNYCYNDYDKYIPSPFNADGSRNEAYYTTAYSTANALSDFDGVGNTKILTDLATAQSDWKTASIITNSSDAGYYPAACCCWRFHTAGTEQGQWYLPACGEFGYVINRQSAINETINKVKGAYASVVAAATLTSDGYCSSSESSAYGARGLNTYNGDVYRSSKDGNHFVRAFIRL